MASGSFNLTRTGATSSYVNFLVNWSSYSNGSVANSSTLSVAVYVTKSSGSTSSTWGTTNTSVSVTDAGTQYENGLSLNVAPNGTQLIFAKNFTVPHNSDGKKTATISVNVGGDVVWGNGSANITLETIPRASDVSGGTGNINENTTINISKKNSAFTHTLLYQFGNLSGTIVSKTSSTSVTWKIPEEFYTMIPTANSGVGTITCITYSGNDEVGRTTCSFTAKVTNSNPKFNNFDYQDTNEKVTSITENNQVLLKGLSTLQVKISSDDKMVAVNSASAKNYTTSIENININTDYSTDDLSIDIGTIKSTGTQRLNVRAYDSRNNSTLVYKDITIYDYEKPVINATVNRLNNFEEQTTLSISGNYSRLTIDSEDKNTINSIQYRYKEIDGDWIDWVELDCSVSNGVFSCDDVILSLDNTKAFLFEVKATDKLEKNSVELTLDVGQAIFFISSNKKACYINGQEILTYEIVDEWEEE